MAVNSRESLKQYALRDLGAPVIQINVANEQLEDRLDEAIQYFQIYHYDGIERVYLKHKITCSEVTITGSNGNLFESGTILKGLSSLSEGTIQTNLENNKIRIRNVKGGFLPNELVSNGNQTATLVSSGHYQSGDTENRYIPIPDIIYGVNKVIPFRLGSSSASLFDVQYQMRLSDLYEVNNTSLVDYTMTMQHIALLDQMLNGYPQFEFNRLGSKLTLEINWNKLSTDDYIILDTYRALDPNTNIKMWGEPWLKRYVTALFKKTWATNLKKYQNMQLPGGVVVDGQSMYSEAIQEIQDLEEELQTKSSPLNFMVG